jgi:hypothetical protein
MEESKVEKSKVILEPTLKQLDKERQHNKTRIDELEDRAVVIFGKDTQLARETYDVVNKCFQEYIELFSTFSYELRSDWLQDSQEQSKKFRERF